MGGSSVQCHAWKPSFLDHVRQQPADFFPDDFAALPHFEACAITCDDSAAFVSNGGRVPPIPAR